MINVGTKVNTFSKLYGARTGTVVRITKTRIIVKGEDRLERAYRTRDGYLVGTEHPDAERILGDYFPLTSF